MRVAVLTLTRDRLDYTKHCFATLRANAGCDYDHYVLDNGSTDETVPWLLSGSYDVSATGQNMGIARGMNALLDHVLPRGYDVVVKFDNDCELLTPNTLRDVCEAALDMDAIVSPRIHGLNNPPASRADLVHSGQPDLALCHNIGGIFMALPAHIFTDGFRYDEALPLWGGDDMQICVHHGVCGYLDGYEANHYKTTNGQHADIPDYFARTLAEGKPSL